MNFKVIYSHNIVNEIPLKFFWFKNLHFLMEDDSMQLCAGQYKYFIVVMSLLFFTALFKDIYSSHHFPSLPPMPSKNLHPNPRRERMRRNRINIVLCCYPDSVKEGDDF